MTPQEIIRKKRDGGALGPDEIAAFVHGVVDGTFADYQAAALLMAVYLNGMTGAETATLTDAMMRSGEVMDFPSIGRPKVDKHSTGGVGDKVSLVLAPLAAAAGLCVPMISGRGLGHTGGTLDKLEAIPGFRTGLTPAEITRQLEQEFVVIARQTADLAPADKKLYALRDVTETVASVPLIAASIMSKKLAEGIDALVLDVKCGRGAFMADEAGARALAREMVAIGAATGVPTTALVTAMDEPLGRAVGNAVEVAEAVACLRGDGSDDLMEVVFALGEQMLLAAGLSSSPDAARQSLRAEIEGGGALRRFARLVAAQGGDPAVAEDPGAVLPAAGHSRPFYGRGDPDKGFVQAVDALHVGRAAMALGAGRAALGDDLDLAAGLTDLKKVGEPIAPGQPLCLMAAGDPARFAAAETHLRDAFVLGPEPPAPNKRVLGVVAQDDGE